MYHHGNLRAELLSVAVGLGRSNGPDGVVLREVARRAGVSHNAAYRHFANREELLQAVGKIGLDELSDRMRLRINEVKVDDPVERSRHRLSAVGAAYVEYALAEPGLFGVAFNAASLGAISGAHEVLSAVLDDCIDAGFVPPEKRPGAELFCWSTVHGFAMLFAGPFRELPPDEREVQLAIVLDRIADSLAAG